MWREAEGFAVVEAPAPLETCSTEIDCLGPTRGVVLSAFLMFQRFAKALKVAVRDEGFVQILGTRILLVIVGTLTYTTSQDWSLVDGFYFAVATLTTSSIADPNLTITGWPVKVFTVFCILVGIGILVELVRQIGFAYVEVRREEKAVRTPKPQGRHELT